MDKGSITPGWPGRGYESPEFTDLQWFMYHQQNTVYICAFSSDDCTHDVLIDRARGMIAAVPELNAFYRNRVDPPTDEILAQVTSIETVDSFDGLKDRWLNDNEPYDDPDLPFFRLRVARLETPDAAGRRCFFLARSLHVVAEGTDAAAMARSRREGGARAPARVVSPWTTFFARIVAVLAIPAQMLISALYQPCPGPMRLVTRAVPRADIAAMARRLGVRQRSLLFALTAFVVSGSGTPKGKPWIWTLYSTLKAGSPASRDSSIRMRLAFAAFRNKPDFAAFAKHLDTRLAWAEAHDSGFHDDLHATGLSCHRWLSRRLPWLYTPRLFSFMWYDLLFSLTPPYRPDGSLLGTMMEPVYSGGTMKGINGCITVPGRAFVTLSFALEEKHLPRLEALDQLMAQMPVSPRSESETYAATAGTTAENPVG